MRYFCVIRDRQGGEFGMDRVYTAKEWGEQAYEWADSDEYENAEEFFIDNYENEDALIHDIADWWELDFAELNEEQKIKYEEYQKQTDAINAKISDAYWKNDKELMRELEKERYQITDAYYDFLDTLKEV